MKGGVRRVDQARLLFLDQYLGKMANLLRIRCRGAAPAALQHVNVEGPQSRQRQDYGVLAELQPGEEHRLILGNLLWAKLIGRTTTVSVAVRNTVKVSADVCRGEVAALQLLKHELTHIVHGGSSSFSGSFTIRLRELGWLVYGCWTSFSLKHSAGPNARPWSRIWSNIAPKGLQKRLYFHLYSMDNKRTPTLTHRLLTG